MTPSVGPQGTYLNAVVAGELVFVAGMTPRVDGVVAHQGRAGIEVSIDDAVAAATLAAERALAAGDAIVPSGFRIANAFRLVVYIQTGRGFEHHSRIADGASATLLERFGKDGVGVRAAVGVSSLPSDSVVEIELGLRLEPV